MKYLALLYANLQRKRLRTTLTIASILVAFLLFGILEAMRFALSGGAQIQGQDRLITINKISIIQNLPASYENRIRTVPGVKVTNSQNWFGGVYQEDRNQLGTFAVESETFFEANPDIQLTDAEKKAWLADQAGALVGSDVAARFGWKVGQTIPMRSNIFTRTDGSNIWEMKICGIYTIRNGDNTAVFFHYKYFNEGLNSMFGKDNIGMVVLRVDDPARSDEIARNVDSLFANSTTETKTTTEQAFIQGFANQMGNIGAIITVVVTAVFFTMLLVTANSMAQSIRERTNEIAVMKTLGFSSRTIVSLILCESLLITVIGGGLGLLLANAAVNGVPAGVKQYFPTIAIAPQSYVVAAIIIVTLGAISAILPCYQAGRLKIVDALRKA
jgi:putative ABC transport system permease protein